MYEDQRILRARVRGGSRSGAGQRPLRVRFEPRTYPFHVHHLRETSGEGAAA